MTSPRSAFAVVLIALAALAEPDTRPQPTLHVIGPGDYQSFIAWDDTRQPLLCAVVKSPADWEKLFHPAALGLGPDTGRKPFSPPASSFDRELLLVVARVTPAPADGRSAFTIEGTGITNGVLTLRYRFTKPAADAGYTIRDFAGVFVPRAGHTHIVFVENGKPVSEQPSGG